MATTLLAIDATTTKQQIYDTDVEVLQALLTKHSINTRNMTRQQIEDLAVSVARNLLFEMFSERAAMTKMHGSDNVVDYYA